MATEVASAASDAPAGDTEAPADAAAAISAASTPATAAPLGPAAVDLVALSAMLGPEDGLEEAEKPAEDLELRQKLSEFTTSHGGPKEACPTLVNALKILQKLKKEPSNVKLHAMRRDLLERIIGEDLFFALKAAGFQERPAQDGTAASFQWAWRVDGSAIRVLHTAVYEVQRAVDACLDPATVSFAQVSELVQQGRTLPGIADIDDSVDTPIEAKAPAMNRPKKPWEK
eukprot:gnl/TRDRNA2_/TRDRNA2_195621_c0_seq1.p1 gnl/TRDRNA2_/TRDRNA2_195621_c0~~gnl/TRDRNA2_/TRDRNA2_195621_c0_seq1.p1  ORF type:complete len:242 (-),score=58.47 gnl/TRDRNA2_/TRDRNA2_195621_c0_seq1:42-728(-)